MDETSQAFRPPHMPFSTFNGLIADLASRPLPPQIDRKMLSHKSGTDQQNLMAALQTFELIDKDNNVLPGLTALAVADRERRQAQLAELVRQFYPRAVELSEINGNESQLTAYFRDDLGLNSSADTRRKAMTFFLHAASAAGIKISDYFPKTRSGSGGSGTSRAKKRSGTHKPPAAPAAQQQANGSAPGDAEARKTFDDEVQLQAGRVVLTVDVNPIKLRGDDRAFFFGLLDMMDEYRNAHPNPPADNGEAPHHDANEEDSS